MDVKTHILTSFMCGGIWFNDHSLFQSAQKSKSRSFILQLNYLKEQNKCEMYLFHQDKFGIILQSVDDIDVCFINDKITVIKNCGCNVALIVSCRF